MPTIWALLSSFKFCWRRSGTIARDFLSCWWWCFSGRAYRSHLVQYGPQDDGGSGGGGDCRIRSLHEGPAPSLRDFSSAGILLFAFGFGLGVGVSPSCNVIFEGAEPTTLVSLWIYRGPPGTCWTGAEIFSTFSVSGRDPGVRVSGDLFRPSNSYLRQPKLPGCGYGCYRSSLVVLGSADQRGSNRAPEGHFRLHGGIRPAVFQSGSRRDFGRSRHMFSGVCRLATLPFAGSGRIGEFGDCGFRRHVDAIRAS